MRLVLAALAVGLALAPACGSVDADDAGEATTAGERLMPTPPIERLDRPASQAPLWSSDELADRSSASFCLFYVEAGDHGDGPDPPAEPDAGHCGEPSGEALERARREHRQWQEAVAPADGSQARDIARLRLAAGQSLTLAAWRNAGGLVCLSEGIWDGSGGGSSVFGPCVPDGGCPAWCLQSHSYEAGDGTRYVLFGTVPSRADALRIGIRDGEVRRYPLAGPLVPASDTRAVIIDLGLKNYRWFQVIHGAAVIAERRMDPTEAAFEVCHEEHGDGFDGPTMPSAAEFREWSERIEACVRRHGIDPAEEEAGDSSPNDHDESAG